MGKLSLCNPLAGGENVTNRNIGTCCKLASFPREEFSCTGFFKITAFWVAFGVYFGALLAPLRTLKELCVCVPDSSTASTAQLLASQPPLVLQKSVSSLQKPTLVVSQEVGI